LSAKPLNLFACAGLLLGAALVPCTAHAAAPVTLVLFPRTLSSDDDVKALVDVRRKLRSDAAYTVITYDPNSAAVKRAAGEAHHPEWLTDPMGDDAERLALTRALGASFSIVIAKADGRGKMDVRVNEAAVSARTWSGYDEKADDADRFIRQQASFALANRVPGSAVLPPPIAVVGKVSAPPVAPSVSAPTRLAPSAVPGSAPPAQAATPVPAPRIPATVPAPVVSVPPAAIVPNASPAPVTDVSSAPVAAPSVPVPTPIAVPSPAPAITPPAIVPAPASSAPIAVPDAPLPAVSSGAALVPAPPASVPPSIVPAPAITPPAEVPAVPTAPLPQPTVRTLPAVPVVTKRVPSALSASAPNSVPAVSVPARIVPPAQTAPPLRVSAATPGQSKAEQTLVVPSPLPIPAPSQVVIAPAPPVAAPPVARSDEDLMPVRAIITQGDDALSAGNFVAAISAYRDAVNGAPLAMTPRLKLAQAYLQSDRRDKALSEAQRALSIAPNAPAVQQFLMQLDAETGSSDGAVARFQSVVTQSPQDPAAHLALADALWNNGVLTQAEDEYQTAQTLAGPRTPAAQQAAAHLARLYAAQSRYADSLAALKRAGAGGYALALGIVQSRADTLRSMLDTGLGSMDAGKTTHEAFYKTASDAAAQVQALADFVVKVSPPSAFALSHLHRVLATHLMAQQAAVLVNYVETSDASFSGLAARLEKEAVTEMLTAHAAEQKLGLWDQPRTEARNSVILPY